jgi:mono/diheme cytochrome c family protein
MTGRRYLFPGVVLGLSLFLSGCSAEPFSEPQILGGKRITASTLNRGAKVYSAYCGRCHAANGKGVHGKYGHTPIIDLTLGSYKYAVAPEGALPPDEDLQRVVRRGLGVRRMPAFTGLSDPQIGDVVHYIKTLSPRWRQERAGTSLKISDDPWGDQRPMGKERGKFVYHKVARCWTCHPSYLSDSDLRALFPEKSGDMDAEFRPGLTRPVPVSTPHGNLIPPDFRANELRVGGRSDDLYRVISMGVPGSAMPAWSESFSQRDLWALVHYVRALAEQKR